MKSTGTEKLELVYEMKRRYPDRINEDIFSIKFCQNDKMVFLVISLYSNPNKPIISNLDFIGNDDDLDSSLFLPDNDIVDNAITFSQLEQYTLLMCVDGFFTREAEEIIECTARA